MYFQYNEWIKPNEDKRLGYLFTYSAGQKTLINSFRLTSHFQEKHSFPIGISLRTFLHSSMFKSLTLLKVTKLVEMF